MVVTASFGVRGDSARSRRTISVHDLGADCGALNSTYIIWVWVGGVWGYALFCCPCSHSEGMRVCIMSAPRSYHTLPTP